MNVISNFFKFIKLWIVAVCCCGISLILDGIFRSSGLFFVAVLEAFKVDRISASLPFATCIAARNISGIFIGVLAKKYGPGSITLLGGFLGAIGVGLCYLSTSLTWITVLYGLIFGIGYGMGNTYKDSVSSAAGFSFTGCCLGSLFLPPLFSVIIDYCGVRGSFLMTAGLLLNCIPLSMILIHFGRSETRETLSCARKRSKSADETVKCNATGNWSLNPNQDGRKLWKPVSKPNPLRTVSIDVNCDYSKCYETSKSFTVSPNTSNNGSGTRSSSSGPTSQSDSNATPDISVTYGSTMPGEEVRNVTSMDRKASRNDEEFPNESAIEITGEVFDPCGNPKPKLSSSQPQDILNTKKTLDADGGGTSPRSSRNHIYSSLTITKKSNFSKVDTPHAGETTESKTNQCSSQINAVMEANKETALCSNFDTDIVISKPLDHVISQTISSKDEKTADDVSEKVERVPNSQNSLSANSGNREIQDTQPVEIQNSEHVQLITSPVSPKISNTGSRENVSHSPASLGNHHSGNREIQDTQPVEIQNSEHVPLITSPVSPKISNTESRENVSHSPASLGNHQPDSFQSAENLTVCTSTTPAGCTKQPNPQCCFSLKVISDGSRVFSETLNVEEVSEPKCFQNSLNAQPAKDSVQYHNLQERLPTISCTDTSETVDVTRKANTNATNTKSKEHELTCRQSNSSLNGVRCQEDSSIPVIVIRRDDESSKTVSQKESKTPRVQRQISCPPVVADDLPKRNGKQPNDNNLPKLKVTVIEYTLTDEGFDRLRNEAKPRPKKSYRRHANSVSHKYFESRDSEGIGNAAKWAFQLENGLPKNRLEALSKSLTSKITIPENDTTKNCPGKSRTFKNETGKSRSLTMIKNPCFLVVCLLMSFYEYIFVATTTIVVDYSTDFGIPAYYAKWLLLAFSAGSILGRSCLGWFTDGALMQRNVLVAVCFVGMAFTVTGMSQAFSFKTLLMFYAGYGIFESGAMFTFPLLMRQYLKESDLHTAFTLSNCCSGITTLLVPVSIGIFRDTSGSYENLFYVMIALATAGSFICLVLPCLQGERKK